MRCFVLCSVAMGLMCIASLASAAPQPAALLDNLVTPEAVTISPNQCLATASVPVPANGTAVFLLDAHSNPNNVSLMPVEESGGSLRSLSWRRIPLVDDAAVASLRSSMEAAKTLLEELNAGIAAIDAQVAYLQKLPGFAPTAAEEALLAAEGLGQRLAALGGQRLPLVLKRDAAQREVSRLEQELREMTGNAYHAWQMTAQFDAAGKAFAANATYPLNQCGWKPFYRLDAQPGEEAVSFTYEAQVWQRTGRDWDNVRLTLATTMPRRGLTPPEMRDWVIQEQQVVKPAPRAARKMKRAVPQSLQPMADAAPQAMVGAAPPAPVQQQRATYTAWDLGTRSIPAGESPRLEISMDAWPAAFRYTIRPAFGPQAWLTANATLPSVQDLPIGEALFMVDGSLAGRQSFALSGNQTNLFFGEAPFIKASTKLIAKESGERGLLATKQTFQWQWAFQVANLGDADALIRIEEPAPQRRDERIELRIDSTPEARAATSVGPDGQEQQLLIWEETLAPGGEVTITHGVTLSAPKDMDVDTGWR